MTQAPNPTADPLARLREIMGEATARPWVAPDDSPIRPPIGSHDWGYGDDGGDWRSPAFCRRCGAVHITELADDDPCDWRLGDPKPDYPLDEVAPTAIVASKRVADFVVSEGAVEAAARVIAYELGDTMGDSRGVFWSAQGRAAKEGWKDAAYKVLQLIASAGVSDHG